jgi:uncharacterized membrane protein (DUF2068 family)
MKGIFVIVRGERMLIGRPKRPFGVTVIVLLTLASVLVTLFPILTIPSLPLVRELEVYGAITPSDVVNFMLIPAQLVLAFGLWYLKRWAWVLYMIQLGISMVVGLQSHFAGQAESDYVVMAVNVLVVFYLNQGDVQRAFGYNPPHQIEEVTA